MNVSPDVPHVGLSRQVKLAVECASLFVEEIVAGELVRTAAVDDHDVIARMHVETRLQARDVDLDPDRVVFTTTPPRVFPALR